MLLCLAYPRLTDSDVELISSFRQRHDQKYANVVDLHWTIIFPGSCEGVIQEDLREHIRTIAFNSNPIKFVCRYALVYDTKVLTTTTSFWFPTKAFQESVSCTINFTADS